MRLSRRGAAVLLTLYLLVAALVVLWPTDWLSALSVGELRTVKHEIGAPAWISDGQVGFAANVLLFVPISFLGSRLLPRWRWAAWLVAGLAGATAIETTQMLFLSHRHASVADVVANTLGAVTGYAIAVVILRRRRG